MPQSINEQIGVLPAIKAELHLFEIGRKMLCADSVPGSHYAAFEKGESGFDGVRMNIAHDIDTGTVTDGLELFSSK